MESHLRRDRGGEITVKLRHEKTNTEPRLAALSYLMGAHGSETGEQLEWRIIQCGVRVDW